MMDTGFVVSPVACGRARTALRHLAEQWGEQALRSQIPENAASHAELAVHFANALLEITEAPHVYTWIAASEVPRELIEEGA